VCVCVCVFKQIKREEEERGSEAVERCAKDIPPLRVNPIVGHAHIYVYIYIYIYIGLTLTPNPRGSERARVNPGGGAATS